MTREEAIEKWIMPACKKVWNEKRCDEILKALECCNPCDLCGFAPASSVDGKPCTMCPATRAMTVDESVDESPGSVDERVDERVDDCISRQAVLDLVEGWWIGHTKEDDLATEIKALPPVTPAEKVGRWVMPVQDDGMSDTIYYQVRCSECGFDLDPQTWHQELYQFGADKYCPKCGCLMKGGEL